jgi:hypothetical protein
MATLQLSKHNQLLVHDSITNPNAVGMLQSECCCDDITRVRCQWSYDFFWVSLGGCENGQWVHGQQSNFPGDSNLAYATYPTSGGITASKIYSFANGTYPETYTLRYCIMGHTSAGSWAAEDKAYWSEDDFWAIMPSTTQRNTDYGMENFPECYAYQVTTAIGNPAPTPGVHCWDDTVAFYTMGQNNNMSGCVATRYGPIHSVACPVIPDVSASDPTACKHEYMGGGCYRCGPTNQCYSSLFTPGVHGCSLDVTGDFTWSDNAGKSGTLQFYKTVPLFKCPVFPNYNIVYEWDEDNDIINAFNCSPYQDALVTQILIYSSSPTYVCRVNFRWCWSGSPSIYSSSMYFQFNPNVPVPGCYQIGDMDYLTYNGDSPPNTGAGSTLTVAMVAGAYAT